MIELNLIPRGVREENLGTERFRKLCCCLLFRCAIAGSVLGLVVISPGAWWGRESDALRSSVAVISNEIAAQHSSLVALNRTRELLEDSIIAGRFIPAVFESISLASTSRVTLKDVRVSSGRVVLSGVAVDAATLADFIATFTHGLPGISATVERVSKTTIGTQTLEHFAVLAIPTAALYQAPGK